MDTFKCIKERRSVRKFKDKKVPDDVIEKILEAGRWAPTARHIEPWKFIVIKDGKLLNEISEEADYGNFIKDAAFAIAVVTDPSSKWHNVDGALVTENLALEAWNEGLGTCWIGSLNRDKAKEILEVPEELHLLTIMPFGYPDEEPSSTRKPLEEVVYKEKFGQS